MRTLSIVVSNGTSPPSRGKLECAVLRRTVVIPSTGNYDCPGYRRQLLRLKTAIDGNQKSGPRIYPSGLLISKAGGHGDVRLLSDGTKLIDNWFIGGPFDYCRRR